MIDLREEEKILFEVRKHWFIIATELAVLIIFAFIPLIIPPVLSYLNVDILIGGLGGSSNLFIFIYMIWLLILWITGFIFWTNYFLDVWIVTNEKIIDVEQISLFSREVSILHLDRIQDITTEVNGIINTFLKFGDLHVQTAGQQREFVIDSVKNPNEVSRRINEIVMEYKKQNSEKEDDEKEILKNI